MVWCHRGWFNGRPSGWPDSFSMSLLHPDSQYYANQRRSRNRLSGTLMLVLTLAAAAGATRKCVSPQPSEFVPIQPIRRHYKNVLPRPPHSLRDPPFSKYGPSISLDLQIRPRTTDPELPSVIILVNLSLRLERHFRLCCLARGLF